MVSLAEKLPQLATELGMPLQHEPSSKNLAIVTFRDSGDPNRPYPVADLPPLYTRFGILEEKHVGKVHPGETWVVEHTSISSGAVFLHPMLKIDLSTLFLVDSNLLADLAGALVDHQPDLLEQFKEYLPDLVPKVDGIGNQSQSKKAKKLRHELGEVRDRISKLVNGLETDGKQKAKLELATQRAKAILEDLDFTLQELDQEEAPAAVTLPPRQEKTATTPIYLADANLFINAARYDDAEANAIIDAAGEKFILATTERVYSELIHTYRLPDGLMRVSAGAIDERLYDLADANMNRITGKKAGSNDLSLIQALANDDRFNGIISGDGDILNMHPASIIRELTGRETECMHPAQFIANHRKYFPSA